MSIGCSFAINCQKFRDNLPKAMWLMTSLLLSLLGNNPTHARDCKGAGDGIAHSESELNRLIACFNDQQPVGDHTISLGADLVLHSGGLTPITLDQYTKKLTIRGNQFSITGNAQHNGLEVMGQSKVELKGMQIRNANYGVYISAAAGDVTIVDSTFSDNASGVYTAGGLVRFSHSRADNNRQYGIFVEDPSRQIKAGFHMSDSSASHNGEDGINIYSAANAFKAIIRRSIIESNQKDGIEVFYTNGVLLEKNSVINNDVGIRIESSHTKIAYTSISENTTGILISEPESEVEIQNSYLSFNKTGMSANNGMIKILSATVAYSTINGISAHIGVDPALPTKLILSSATLSSDGFSSYGDDVVANKSTSINSSFYGGEASLADVGINTSGDC